ncbi:uncharacterized protein CTRU02_207290 [Colletotrichum truncatum]|uniref:Uncharacterized protein n=1 Tax=Colletotrichum truncatum TaxID=5467 RepID=A0ACC3Z0G6_COLTU|nr:uncharacterized protein CTRU02_01075 [Colletotrichum truncatum]KAF6800670.1 hypothetical protein CTRU02_01075 [Colletotrichum truncatum]
MQSSRPSVSPDFWLEPLTIDNHIQDFHELCADESAAQWSTQRPTESFESSRELMKRVFIWNPQKPWIINYAFMSSKYSAPDSDGSSGNTRPKMVGIVKTTRESPWGLSIGYKVRSDCWGKGYATRAVKMFLDEYWSQPRKAPREAIYGTREKNEADIVTFHVTPALDVSDQTQNMGKPDSEEDGDGEIEITHLIAQIDPMNLGSMRVAEKCDGNFITISKKSLKVWRFDEMRDLAVFRFVKPSAVAPPG